MFGYACLWNTFHPYFHEIELGYDIKTGIPSIEGLKDKHHPIIVWLFKNHALHHLNKDPKKSNFNIVLPGADFLMGTYKSKVDNRKYCENYNGNEKKILDLCKKELNIKKVQYKRRFMTKKTLEKYDKLVKKRKKLKKRRA